MKHWFILFVLFASTQLLAQSKIGVVNIQKVLDTLPGRKLEMDKIHKQELLFAEDVRQMDSVINSVLWGENMMIEKSMSPEQIRLFMLENDHRKIVYDQQIASSIKTFDMEYVRKVNECVAKIAEKMKLKCVVNASDLIYSKGLRDITNLVITEMLKTP